MVDLTSAAPFAAGELASAMRVRLAPEGAPVHVRVTPTPTGARVEARGGVREVALGGLGGAAAARLVALAASDLLLDDLASPPLSPPSLSRVNRADVRGAATVGVFGGAAGWDGVLGGLTLDGALPRDRWLITIDLGAATLVDGPVNLTSGVVRLGGGVRAGLFELRAGLTVASVFVSDGAGDRTVLVGAGTSLRFRAPVTSGIRAVFVGGVDAFATRTEYRLDGMTAMATPRLAPWIAAGIEVTP